MFQKLLGRRLLGLGRWLDGVVGLFFCSGFWFLLLHVCIGCWSDSCLWAWHRSRDRSRSGYGLGVVPEAIGSFRGLVSLLEIGVHAWGASSPLVDR